MFYLRKVTKTVSWATSRRWVFDEFGPSPKIVAYRKELYGAQQIEVIFPQKTNVCLKAKQ
jgi:hypothetical protein